MKLILGAKYKKTELGKNFPATKDLPDEVYIKSIGYSKLEDTQSPIKIWVIPNIKKGLYTHGIFKDIFIACYDLIQLPNILQVTVITIDNDLYVQERTNTDICLHQLEPFTTETPDNELTHY